MLSTNDCKDVSQKLGEITGRVAADYKDREVVDEESFSGELCGRIKEGLRDFKSENFKWQSDVAREDEASARIRMRNLSKHTEEPRFGADMVMVLHVQKGQRSFSKGVLAQAKRLERDRKMPKRDLARLVRQCQKMLSVSAASIVLLYHRNGVTPVSAAAVVSHETQSLFSIPTWNIETMFFDFAMCWIGDPKIHASDQKSLEAIRHLSGAGNAVHLVASPLVLEDKV